MIWVLLGCASGDPHWAINHLSLIPASSGAEGTQSWEFFSKAWRKNRNEKNFLCARTQEVTGTVVAPLDGCEGCITAYELDISEVETDCTSDISEEAALLAEDEGFAATLQIAIGDVFTDFSEMDPYPGKSMGWYLSTDNETYQPWGFAYPEGLDFDGETGAPGWTSGQVYTLMPAVALEL